jgi:hypothetical protein
MHMCLKDCSFLLFWTIIGGSKCAIVTINICEVQREVCDKPMSRMAHAAVRLDGLMRWGTELSLDAMVHLLQESNVNNW